MALAIPAAIARPASTELREWITTENPSAANRLAIAAPMPEVAPVISATGLSPTVIDTPQVYHDEYTRPDRRVN
jgi:hypothetical protein